MSVSLSRELREIQLELQSSHTKKKIYAIHKVISYMNMGKDVSGLFFSVMKCLEISNVEIKKLVYLYITQYSQELPEETIMCVNSFVRDAMDKRNSLVRAMAIRTMGCLRVKELNENFVLPLNEALSDEDAYVKKIAVMTVAKIYEINPEMIENAGIIDKLIAILRSSTNPVILSNTLIAISEIEKFKNEKILKPDFKMMEKIVNSLPECTEWGQVSILEIIGQIETKDKALAEMVVDRVLSRLSHINPAVIVASVKVILKYTLILDNKKILEGICNKLSSPLITLLNSSNEISWILLTNIGVLIDKFKTIFMDIRVFFVKYNDPSYIKLEKLKIIEKLATDVNNKLVINELVEYSYDLDLDFSRKAVKAIWKLAMKFPKEVDSCVSALQAILKNSDGNNFASHLLNEIVIGIDYMFRKYRNKAPLNSSVKILKDNYKFLNEDQSQISFLDLLTEFLDIMPKKEEIIKNYLDEFSSKSLEVQMALLTSSMKVYLNDPDSLQEEIIKLLEYASENIENPDLRDRAFIYWRLLNINANVAKRVLFAQRPKIQYKLSSLNDKEKIHQLFEKLGTLAVSYNNPQFGEIKNNVNKRQNKFDGEDQDLLGDKEEEIVEQTQNDDFLNFEIKPSQNNNPEKSEQNQPDLLNLFEEKPKIQKPVKKQTKSQNKQNPYDNFDFLGMGEITPAPNQPPQTKTQEIKSEKKDDPFNFTDLKITPSQKKPNNQSNRKQSDIMICLNINDTGSNGNKGVQILAKIIKEGETRIDFTIQNFSNSVLEFVKFEIKPNSFGAKCVSQQFNLNLATGQTSNIKCPISFNPDQKTQNFLEPVLDFEIQTNIDTFSFKLKSQMTYFLVR